MRPPRPGPVGPPQPVPVDLDRFKDNPEYFWGIVRAKVEEAQAAGPDRSVADILLDMESDLRFWATILGQQRVREDDEPPLH